MVADRVGAGRLHPFGKKCCSRRAITTLFTKSMSSDGVNDARGGFDLDELPVVSEHCHSEQRARHVVVTEPFADDGPDQRHVRRRHDSSIARPYP